MTRLVLLLATVAVCVGACSAAPILSPTPNTTSPPNPPPVPSASSAGWTVTSETIGNTGPAFCIWTAAVGMTFTGDYAVKWNGSTVSFLPSDRLSGGKRSHKHDPVARPVRTGTLHEHPAERSQRKPGLASH
jgi:hypothetical protein